MKNVSLIALFSLSSLMLFSYIQIQGQEQECQQTCIVKKTVATGALIGAMVKPVCGEDGLKVFEVVANTFAENVGLQEGDIIYEVNGENVHFTREIKAVLAELEPEDNAEIKYLRNSISYTVEGDLGAREYEEIEVEECCDGAFSVRNVRIGPNPTQGKFRLNFDALVMEPSLSIQVFDLNGKEVIVEELLNYKGQFSKEYDLAGKGSGLYIVEISNGQKNRVNKIMLSDR